MGSAASASASEQVQGASPEEIQAYLNTLAPEDRAKLEGALAAAEAVAPAEAAGDAAAAAPAELDTEAAVEGAPEDEPVSPAAAITAPHLSEYFDKVQKRTAAMVADQERLLALASDPEATKKLQEESAAWFEEEAKPLLVKSFKHHDKNESDLLETEEAAKFFKHMVEVETDFAQAMSAFTIEAGVKLSMGSLQGLSDEDREKIKPFLEAEMKKNIEAAQAEVQKKEDNYRANKAEYNAAAFKVLDTNKDGKIQLSEFLAAFEPANSKHMEMHVALGYVTKEEIEEQSKRQEQMKEQADGCAQQ